MVRTEILVRQGNEFIVDDATETRYQLASVSKQFTAAAVLLLADDGALRLDDTIGHWLDGCPDEWQGITLHHLLTHTSGLGHWHDYPMINLGEWVEPANSSRRSIACRSGTHRARAGVTAARRMCCWPASSNAPPEAPTGCSLPTGFSAHSG